jgi:hypothetical protein
MLHVGDICCVGNICFGIILDCIVIFACCIFGKVYFTTVIMPDFLLELIRI